GDALKLLQLLHIAAHDLVRTLGQAICLILGIMLHGGVHDLFEAKSVAPSDVSALDRGDVAAKESDRKRMALNLLDRRLEVRVPSANPQLTKQGYACRGREMLQRPTDNEPVLPKLRQRLAGGDHDQARIVIGQAFDERRQRLVLELAAAVFWRPLQR